MAQFVVLMAGLLLIAESQASDVADRSTHQGFLSKYVPRGETSISNKDFDPPKIANRDVSNNSISLSAIGIGLLSLVTMLVVRLRRGLQPATIFASSGGLGPCLRESPREAQREAFRMFLTQANTQIP